MKDQLNEKEINFSLTYKEKRCYNIGQGSGLVWKCLLYNQEDLTEFRPEHPHKKPGTVTCACSVLLEVGEIGGSLGLASQLV